MSDHAKAAKATFDIELGGKKYILSPLTLGDLGQFCQYAQYRDYYLLRKSDIPEAEAALKDCFDECRRRKVGIGSAEFVEALQTADGLAYFLYLSLRHKHNTLTAEALEGQLTLHQLNDMADIVGELSGIIDSRKKKTPSNRD